jgi:hypothetical protein
MLSRFVANDVVIARWQHAVSAMRPTSRRQTIAWMVSKALVYRGDARWNLRLTGRASATRNPLVRVAISLSVG